MVSCFHFPEVWFDSFEFERIFRSLRVSAISDSWFLAYSVQNHLHFTTLIIFMENDPLLFGWKRVHFYATRVESCNTSANYKFSTRTLPKFRLDFRRCFSFTLVTRKNLISPVIWWNKHFLIFQDYKCCCV